jgi:predicted small metal-binding protein
LFVSFVVTGAENIPFRAEVEFAVVEHASDSHKKRLASKNVYNHAAEVLRKQQVKCSSSKVAIG